MPLFCFVCPTCGKKLKRFCSLEESKAIQKCKLDGSNMIRDPQASTSQVKETLDNGSMARKLERFADAEDLTYDNSHTEKE